MQTYKYILKGGCGSTEIQLDINSEDNTFKLIYNSHWMGDTEKSASYSGNIEVNNNNYTLKSNDKTFEFTKYDSYKNITEYFDEFAGIVMGGCEFNEEVYQKYNAMLILNSYSYPMYSII